MLFFIAMMLMIPLRTPVLYALGVIFRSSFVVGRICKQIFLITATWLSKRALLFTMAHLYQNSWFTRIC